MLGVYLKVTLISEAVLRGVLKKVFYEYVANLKDNTHAEV